MMPLNAIDLSSSHQCRSVQPSGVCKAVRFKGNVCLEDGIPLAAELLDVARLDILLLADRPIRYGTTLQLAIFSDLVSSVAYTKATVHYCRVTHEGWQIGAFFELPIPDHMIERNWHDLRIQLQYECDWKGWALWDETGRLECVQIVGYSLDGLRLVIDEPVSTGTNVTLYGSGGNRGTSVLKARVEWCRTFDCQTIIGCFIAGGGGRDLPKLFGNLSDVHAVQTEAFCLPASFEMNPSIRTGFEATDQFLL